MEIRQLRYFAAVVEEGTVTGAARRLNMTQPPLTAQLHNLEQELGCQLFTHEGRRLRLTEAGRTLYDRACSILGLCDAAIAEMGDFHTGTAGTLRLGVVSSVQGTLFPKWLKQFAVRYPQVQYDLHSANTYKLLELLQSGGLDLAIVRTPFLAPDLEVQYLRKEYLVAVGTAEFFADIPEQTITLEQLADKPLILYRRWENIVRTRFENAGHIPFIRCFNDDAQTTLALAGHGMGIGLAPSSALAEYNTVPSSLAGQGKKNGQDPSPARRTLLQIRRFDDPAFATEIALVCRSKKRLSMAAQLFWEEMERLFSPHSNPRSCQAPQEDLSS